MPTTKEVRVTPLSQRSLEEQTIQEEQTPQEREIQQEIDDLPLTRVKAIGFSIATAGLGTASYFAVGMISQGGVLAFAAILTPMATAFSALGAIQNIATLIHFNNPNNRVYVDNRPRTIDNVKSQQSQNGVVQNNVVQNNNDIEQPSEQPSNSPTDNIAFRVREEGKTHSKN